MKLLSHILILIFLTSCNPQKPISINFSKVNKIEVYQGYPGVKIKMKDDFEKEFIFDLNKSKNVGPTKYIKTHRILIHHKNGEIDTILTNGTIHQFNGWSKSKIDLLEKYSEGENTNLSDTVNGQLRIAERLKILMTSKKYDNAVKKEPIPQSRKLILDIKDREDNEMIVHVIINFSNAKESLKLDFKKFDSKCKEIIRTTLKKDYFVDIYHTKRLESENAIKKQLDLELDYNLLDVNYVEINDAYLAEELLIKYNREIDSINLEK